MSISFGGQTGYGDGRDGKGMTMNAQTISIDAGELDDAQFQSLISGMDTRRSPIWALFVVLVLAAVILAGCGKATSASTDPTATATATEEAAATGDDEPQVYTPAEISALLEPSTVMVIAEGDGWAMSGTGFIYDDSGLIITNTHVIEGAASVKVYFAGSARMYPAEIIGRSTCDDISVIQINTRDLEEVAIGDSDELVVGQEVMALGFPLAYNIGEDLSLTRGIISRLHVDASIWDDAIQVDAAINPGNSGGPLVNANGEVIGVNSAGYNGSVAQDMNYAVSINHAMDVAELLEVEGDHNWLGLELIPNSPELAAEYGLPTDQGMVVTFVAPGGPADELGLEAGDVILKMQGATVYSMDQVCNIVRTHSLENVRLDIVEYGSTIGAGDNAAQDADTGDEDAGEDDGQDGDEGAEDDDADDGGETDGDQDADDGQNDDDQDGGADDGQNTDDDQADNDDQNDDQAQDDGADDTQSGASYRDDVAALLTANGFELLEATEFTNGDPGSFWTGAGEDGSGISITEDGWYLFEMGADTWWWVYPETVTELADGALVTDVYLMPGSDGMAVGGIMARLDASGSFYYCWARTSGETGCHLNRDGEWELIFATNPGDVPVHDLNTLALVGAGSEFAFEVNGQVAGTFSDSSFALGAWGLIAECSGSPCAVAFDYVDVYSAGAVATDDQQDDASDDQQNDTADDASGEYLLQMDFEDGNAGPWYADSGDGYSFGVEGGWYTMSLADGFYFANVAHDLGDVADAAMSVDFALEGSGYFGLTGRYSLAGDDDQFYFCWVSTAGEAGCSLWINGEWQSLIYADSGIQLAEVNTMTMAMAGDTLYFIVNGQEIGTVTDSALATGMWGMYLSAEGGDLSVYVDYVEIAEITS